MFRSKEFIIEILINLLKSAVAVVVAIILINFLKTKIVNISSSLAMQKQSAYALERRSQTIRQLRTDFESVGEGESYLYSARPDADNVVDFKAALDSIANRQSLQSLVSFALPAPDQTTIDYSVDLSAGASTLINYLKYFEKLPYLTGINSLDIRADQNYSWESSARVGIKARLYTKPVSE